MGETESIKFENGARAFFKRWAGVGSILGFIMGAAIIGHGHLNEIDNSINTLSDKFNATDKRVTALESTSVRDRESIVRIEVQVLHMNEILRRIENKIDSK